MCPKVTTEATAVVEVVVGKKSEDAHWQNLLTYCVNGNLQAVWDEYSHMITSGMDKSAGIVQKLHNEILNGMKIRVGFGFDTHRLAEDRPLILGGVHIASASGCVGHSDADVLIHAICDALLGALNLRDIGYHFRIPGAGSLAYMHYLCIIPIC